MVKLSTEIRMRILSDVLSLDQPIMLTAVGEPPNQRLTQVDKSSGLTALLLVSKTIYHEAAYILYSKNHFEFPNIATPTCRSSTFIRPFLVQIGEHAGLIRSIGIRYPTILERVDGIIKLPEDCLTNFRAVGQLCTGLQTISLTLNTLVGGFESEWHVPDRLAVLNSHFRNLPSLQHVFLDFHIFTDEMVFPLVVGKARDCGWHLRVSRIEPEPREDPDDMELDEQDPNDNREDLDEDFDEGFDDYDDYDDHMPLEETEARSSPDGVDFDLEILSDENIEESDQWEASEESEKSGQSEDSVGPKSPKDSGRQFQHGLNPGLMSQEDIEAIRNREDYSRIRSFGIVKVTTPILDPNPTTDTWQGEWNMLV
jgi:hypothetical protein